MQALFLDQNASRKAIWSPLYLPIRLSRTSARGGHIQPELNDSIHDSGRIYFVECIPEGELSNNPSIHSLDWS